MLVKNGPPARGNKRFVLEVSEATPRRKDQCTKANRHPRVRLRVLQLDFAAVLREFASVVHLLAPPQQEHQLVGYLREGTRLARL
jgi:hypothetical protein